MDVVCFWPKWVSLTGQTHLFIGKVKGKGKAVPVLQLSTTP
jgi:hypothetical protein